MTMTAMDPRTDTDTDEWSGRVATACRLLEANDEGVPALADVAAEVGVSPDALRRAFVRKLGVTPRKYADTLRRERLRDALRDGDDVTRALFTAGYGSTSRLYEGGARAPRHDARVLQGRRRRARPWCSRVADTSLGSLLVAVTERGLCKIDLSDDATGHRGVAARRVPRGRHPARRRRARARRRRRRRPHRRPHPDPGPPARRAGHRVPARRLGGAAADPGR